MTIACGLVSYAALVARLFQSKLMFPSKIMLIYDEPLPSGQPPLSGYLLVPRGWLLNGGLTILEHK